MLFVSVITMIGYFQLFSEPYVMTAGGPLRATTSVVLMMYEEGFRWWRMGYAASIAFVLFIVILIATLIRSEEHTSELQSLAYLVCRLLLDKKKVRPGSRHLPS